MTTGATYITGITGVTGPVQPTGPTGISTFTTFNAQRIIDSMTGCLAIYRQGDGSGGNTLSTLLSNDVSNVVLPPANSIEKPTPYATESDTSPTQSSWVERHLH